MAVELSEMCMAIWRMAGLSASALFLIGCVNNTALDDLRDTTPTGSAFNKALFKN